MNRLLTVYKLMDFKINVTIIKYTWVGSKRIKDDLQSRSVRAEDVSFQDGIDHSAELSFLLRKLIK